MRKFLLLILAIMTVQLYAQDLAHYKKIVKELSSAKYQGRGYAEDGANKAGKWITKEFAKVGADEVTCQPFKLNINTMAPWYSGVARSASIFSSSKFSMST